MTQEKRIAVAVMLVLMAGLTQALPTRAQGPSWESSSKKGKAKDSGMILAKETVPASAGANVPLVNPDEYIVGESDIVHINVWKEAELSQTVVVRPDGKISLPLMNEVKVSGMTPAQIQTLLTTRLKAFIVDPQVTVTVSDVRSKNAFITGEVAHPGAYSLLMPTTVVQLIAKAGGLSPYANRGGIFVLRDVNGKSVRLPFPYKDVLRGKKEDLNIELRPGDTVVVP